MNTIHQLLSRIGMAMVLTGTLAARSATAQPVVAEEADSWKFGIGVGVLSEPRYPGSSTRKTAVLPLLSASYGRYFIGGMPGAGIPVGVGVNLVDQSDWKFGVGVGYDVSKPRKESDDARLKGLGDVSRTPHGAIFGSYTRDWFKVRGNVVTDIGGKHEGTQASLDLEGTYQLTPALSLSAGPGLTWADKKYSQTFFGVDASQSAKSGLTPYTAGSGLNTLRLSVGAEYAFSRDWFIGARISAGTLRGDARNSPITASKSQNTFGLFGVYHF